MNRSWTIKHGELNKETFEVFSSNLAVSYDWSVDKIEPNWNLWGCKPADNELMNQSNVQYVVMIWYQYVGMNYYEHEMFFYEWSRTKRRPVPSNEMREAPRIFLANPEISETKYKRTGYYFNSM